MDTSTPYISLIDVDTRDIMPAAAKIIASMRASEAIASAALARSQMRTKLIIILVGGAAVIIDVLTDNKNRTAGEIRHLLEKHGGNLAAPNAVAWMFEHKGLVAAELPQPNPSKEKIEELERETLEIQRRVLGKGRC